MKRFFTATGLFAVFLFGNWPAVVDSSATGGSFVRPAAAYNDEAYVDFQQALQPYGQWVVTPQWGHVWIPAGTPPGWRPYSNGRWDYTDEYGWMWVSDEEWGWAPFHYGRWAFDQQYGWVWVPGRVWGPAWVSFRYGDTSVGWAPLPPEGDYYDEIPSYGYEPTINISWWNFVPREHFHDRHYRHGDFNYNNNVNYFQKTKNVTNITVINNRVVNNSINVNEFERQTRQRVIRHRVDVADTVVPNRQRSRGNDIVVVRPKDVERHAGPPRIRGGQSQQTGNQNGKNQGNQPGAGPAIVTDRDRGKPNRQGPAQTEILPPTGKPDKHQGNDNRAADRGKPQGPGQPQWLPPAGKPDKFRGQGNWQGGTAQNPMRNGDMRGNTNANANGAGRAKPAPIILPPPPDNGRKHDQGSQLPRANNNRGQPANNGNARNRQGQEAEWQMQQNNRQGQPRPSAGNNPPANDRKKGPVKDCAQGGKNCGKQ
jgi:hypothetical protein